MSTGEPNAAETSLAETLAEPGALPPETVIRVIADAADLLAAVHESGRAHGNITPEAILLSGDRVRLTDPVARFKLNSTDDGFESDVYDLAEVAYRCLGGDPAAIPGEPETFGPLPRTVPKLIVRAVDRGLGHGARRTPSAVRFAKLCRKALPGNDSRGSSGRRGALVAVVVLFLLVVAGGMWWQPWRGETDAAGQDAAGSQAAGRSGLDSAGTLPTGPSTTSSGADESETDDPETAAATEPSQDAPDESLNLPDVRGMYPEDAMARLSDEGFDDVVVEYDDSVTEPDCTIYAQNPPPGSTDPSTTIELVNAGDAELCSPEKETTPPPNP